MLMTLPFVVISSSKYSIAPFQPLSHGQGKRYLGCSFLNMPHSHRTSVPKMEMDRRRKFLPLDHTNTKVLSSKPSNLRYNKKAKLLPFRAKPLWLGAGTEGLLCLYMLKPKKELSSCSSGRLGHGRFLTKIPQTQFS